MPKRSTKQSKAAAAYRSLIDAAVEQARNTALSERIQTQSIYSKAPADRRFNKLVRSLSAEQRKLLAELLCEERKSTIHDLLADWSWWIECEGLGFTLNKTPVPVDLSGMGLHGDFIGRLGDWEWPEDGA